MLIVVLKNFNKVPCVRVIMIVVHMICNVYTCVLFSRRYTTILLICEVIFMCVNIQHFQSIVFIFFYITVFGENVEINTSTCM